MIESQAIEINKQTMKIEGILLGMIKKNWKDRRFVADLEDARWHNKQAII